MKTQFTLEEITRFLESEKRVRSGSVMPLVEGHSSQAVRYLTAEGEFVLRVADKATDFNRDRFAYEHFGPFLPIPPVGEIGTFDRGAFYCITDYIEGKTSNTLAGPELNDALQSIQQNLAATFCADISFSNGYGDVDVASGNDLAG